MVSAETVLSVDIKMMDYLQHYWICHECAVSKGGKLPKGWVGTVMCSDCEYCGAKGLTMIPIRDFRWSEVKKNTKKKSLKTKRKASA